jgi:transposase
LICVTFSKWLESAILGLMRDNDWTRVLGWPGYKVYRHEIDEAVKRLKLWVRRKRANKQLVCSGCGKLVGDIVASYEREVRDLPCFEYLTTVVVELYRVRCPDCGVRTEKVPLLPSKAPFSKRFEDAVGLACISHTPPVEGESLEAKI